MSWFNTRSQRPSRRRQVSASAGVAAVALALTACAGVGDAPPSVEEPAGDEPVTITVWATYSGCENYSTLCDIQDEYTAKYPNVTFENVVHPADSYFTLQRTANASRTGPDILHVMAGQNVIDNAPYLVSLNDVVAESDFDRFTAGLEYSSDNFNPDDGVKMVQVPNQAYVTFYNTTLLADAGFDEAPRTWDELFEVCDALVANGVTPMVLGETNLGPSGFYSAFDLSYLLAGVLSPEEIIDLANGELSWTDSRLEEQLTKWQSLFDRGCVNDNPLTEPEPALRFIEGESAMFSAVAPPGRFTEEEVADKSVMPLPYQDEPRNQLAFMAGNGYGATTYGENQEVALHFLAFMASEEGMTAAAPTRWPAMGGIPQPEGTLHTTLKIQELAEAPDVAVYPFIDNVLPQPVWNAAQGAMQSVLVGLQTPQDALKIIDEASQAAMG